VRNITVPRIVPAWPRNSSQHRIFGWVNVPAGNRDAAFIGDGDAQRD